MEQFNMTLSATYQYSFSQPEFQSRLSFRCRWSCSQRWRTDRTWGWHTSDDGTSGNTQCTSLPQDPVKTQNHDCICTSIIQTLQHTALHFSMLLYTYRPYYFTFFTLYTLLYHSAHYSTLLHYIRILKGNSTYTQLAAIVRSLFFCSHFYYRFIPGTDPWSPGQRFWQLGCRKCQILPGNGWRRQSGHPWASAGTSSWYSQKSAPGTSAICCGTFLQPVGKGR